MASHDVPGSNIRITRSAPGSEATSVDDEVPATTTLNEFEPHRPTPLQAVYVLDL